MSLQLNKIKKDLKKVVKKFWENLLLVLIFFLILDLFIGGILFLKHYLSPSEESSYISIPLKINQVLLDRFSQRYNQKEEIFNQIWNKQYPDLFRGELTER